MPSEKFKSNGNGHFSLPELARLSGIDSRTLHNWIQRGILSPSHQRANGSGTSNVFDAEDALHLVVLADLRRSGAEIKVLEEASDALRQVTSHSTGDELLMITDDVRLVADPTQLAADLDRSGPALMYAISRAHRSLAEFVEASASSSECHGIRSVRAAA